MPTKDTGVVSARMPLRTIEAIDEYARVKGYTRGEVVKKALMKHFQISIDKDARGKHYGSKKKKRR